jgi:hypothetical protein
MRRVESGSDKGSGVWKCRLDLSQQAFESCEQVENTARRGVRCGRKACFSAAIVLR